MHNVTKEPNPVRHVREIGDMYPRIWSIVQDLRLLARREKQPWLSRCYLPAELCGAIVTELDRDTDDDDEDRRLGYASRMSSNMAAVAAWRSTKGVYRFDPTLEEHLIRTPLDGTIPVGILERMPQWCVYIQTPSLLHGNWRLDGFYAVRNASKTRPELQELRIVFDYTSTADMHIAKRDSDIPSVAVALHPFPVPLGHGTIVECLQSLTTYYPGIRVACDAEDFNNFTLKLATYLRPTLSMLLYLCSSEPDIQDKQGVQRTPRNVRPTKTRKGVKEFPASAPEVWNVGWRLGAALRKAEARIASEDQGGTHASPRPHLRSAHWHTYWTGKGRTEPILKWLSPILVNTDSGEDLPAVIRKVAA